MPDLAAILITVEGDSALSIDLAAGQPGAPLTPFTDATGETPISLPASVSGSATWWLPRIYRYVFTSGSQADWASTATPSEKDFVLFEAASSGTSGLTVFRQDISDNDPAWDPYAVAGITSGDLWMILTNTGSVPVVAWAANTGFDEDTLIHPLGHNYYTAVNLGTSDASEPTWTDDGNPVEDNDIEWDDLGSDAPLPSLALNFVSAPNDGALLTIVSGNGRLTAVPVAGSGYFLIGQGVLAGSWRFDASDPAWYPINGVSAI